MKKLLLLLLFLSSTAQAQIFPACNSSGPRGQAFTANLAQAAGNYTLATATGGDVLITKIQPFVVSAAGGLTSITLQSNNTTPDTVLTSTLAAVLTSGKNLTALVTPFVLPSTKAIQYSIVGTGNAGSLTVAVEYESLGGVLQ